MVRIIQVPVPPMPTGWIARRMAAEIWHHGVQRAREKVADAERKLLAAKLPQEKTAAERELLEAHRGLAEARDWEPCHRVTSGRIEQSPASMAN